MALVSIINLLFNIFYILVLARVIFSWVRVSPYHPTWGPILRAVYQLTDPIMEPVRRVIPPMGGIDFSPIIVLLLIDILRRILLNILI